MSRVLILLLILAVLGGGGFLLWRYVLATPQAPGVVDTSAAPAPAPVAVSPPPAPPPPPAPTAKVAMELPAPDEIKVAKASVVETILADKAEVKEGDVMVKLVGNKPIEAEIFALTRDRTRLQAQLDAADKKRTTAEAAGNKAAQTAAQNEMTERQKTLATKTAQLAAKTNELAKYLLTAPANGTFTPAAKLGQKLAASAIAAKLQRPAVPVATFKVTDAKPFEANVVVDLVVGNGEQRVACTVAEQQADNVKVKCPADSGLAEGADVTLRLPPPAAAPTEAPAGGSAPPAEAPAVPGAAPSGSAAAPSGTEPAAAPN